ncbi:MAG: hypothetical protein ACKPE6_05350, partial [Gammaproteobacteria bacterium]
MAESETPDAAAQPEQGHAGQSLVIPEQTLPDILYLMPVTTRPFMPAQIQPMMADAELWQQTIQRVSETEHKVMGLFFVDSQDLSSIRAEDLPAVGCSVRLLNASGDGRRGEVLGADAAEVLGVHEEQPHHLVLGLGDTLDGL